MSMRSQMNLASEAHSSYESFAMSNKKRGRRWDKGKRCFSKIYWWRQQNEQSSYGPGVFRRDHHREMFFPSCVVLPHVLKERSARSCGYGTSRLLVESFLLKRSVLMISPKTCVFRLCPEAVEYPLCWSRQCVKTVGSRTMSFGIEKPPDMALSMPKKLFS